MLSKVNIENKKLFERIKIISNKLRFKILELSQENRPTISELSSRLNLSYTKCSDYVRILEKCNLISKIKDGKKVRIKSKVKLHNNQIIF